MRFIITIAIILLISVSSWSQNSTAKIKPNIILINIDDMGWKDVGFMGSEYYETPNIDKLSASGMVFTNGYAASANCAPSRASLLTGLWTPRHGIFTVGTSERGASKHRKLIPTQNTVTLDKNHIIIPEILKQYGYKTCHAGKWHLSNNPLEYGFEVNIGGGHNGQPTSYYPPYGNVKIKGNNDDYLTDLIMEKTIEYIDTVSSPFFLYYAPYAVHTPIHPVKGLIEKYNQKQGSNGQDNANYATMIENLDRNIGLLITKLKDNGILDNTLIIFTSDNGGVFGITKQRPLRSGKGSFYEGGIRVPFVFVLKNKIVENSKSEIPITNLDLFPTILHYAEINNSQLKLDGTNLFPILERKTKKINRPLYWHFPIYLESITTSDNENRDPLFRTRPGSAIRYGDWKLLYYFENNEVELYNLAQDIEERNNLALKEPKKKDEMLNLLKKWWDETNAPIPTKLNPEYRD